jgi:hypothetical protein
MIVPAAPNKLILCSSSSWDAVKTDFSGIDREYEHLMELTKNMSI